MVQRRAATRGAPESEIALMTLDRLAEIIEEMRRELRTLDECIMALEVVATGRRKRGRPRKRRFQKVTFPFTPD